MMLSHFKRTRPKHEPVRITPQDHVIAEHWGYTDKQWSDLDPWVRVNKRDQFYSEAGL